MTITLTDLEAKYLKTVIAALGATPEEDQDTWFGFEAEPAQGYLNWTFAYNEEAVSNGVSKEQLSGVASSLAQKGILYIDTTGPKDDRSTRVTAQGMNLLREWKANNPS